MLVTAAIERFIDGIVFAMIVGAVALAGRIPNIEGGLRTGLAVAGALNLALFGALLWLLFSARKSLGRGDAPISRAIDWLASKGGGGWPASGRRSPRASSGRAPARGDGA